MYLHCDVLVERIDQLLNFSEELAGRALNSQQNVVKQHLCLTDALSFLKQEGITISKSKIYKLTAEKKIPFKKFNGHLVFSSSELLRWIDSEFSRQNAQKFFVQPLKSKRYGLK